MSVVNLNEYKSLTEEEMQEIDGGIAPLLIVGGLLVVGAGAGLWDAYDESKAKKKKKK
ncbi:class IIb bacteriocin, lactobin A/cerein 7B family [Niallia taxi]|nr:class IIb bacteriocin, lactobin A/cerein 7B family [Niallia taxi]MDE5056012.1 class IIb bacteriocin, lactobin A/cerein 7B family [Niallia taxi]